MFIEALPGLWLRADRIVGVERSGRGVCIAFDTPTSTDRTREHQFNRDEDAQEWAFGLVDELCRP